MHPKDTPIPLGLCQCGCGQPTSLARDTNPKRGDVKGQPVRYVRGHQRRRVYYIIDPVTECHRWQGTKNPDGYGRLCVDGKWWQAHVWFYTQKHGPIPEGHILDHVRARGCLYRDCCNPDHLEPVPHRVNVRRGKLAKLTQSQVDEIRQLQGVQPSTRVGPMYGVSEDAILRIWQRKSWLDHPTGRTSTGRQGTKPRPRD